MAGAVAEGQIADALLWYSGQIVTDPILPIAYPDVSFEPGGSAYLEAQLLPNRNEALGIHFDSDINHIGLLQISVLWPQGKGIVRPMQVVGQVIQYFRRGTRIVQGGTTVLIDEQPSATSPLKEAGWMRYPVTIRWRSTAPVTQEA